MGYVVGCGQQRAERMIVGGGVRREGLARYMYDHHNEVQESRYQQAKRYVFEIIRAAGETNDWPCTLNSTQTRSRIAGWRWFHRIQRCCMVGRCLSKGK
jgi:hypothetical protein